MKNQTFKIGDQGFCGSSINAFQESFISTFGQESKERFIVSKFNSWSGYSIRKKIYKEKVKKKIKMMKNKNYIKNQ